jgi:hypothetical protein
MSDKEQYICLSCYFVGELDIHGRCTKCQSLSVATTEQLQRIDRLLGPRAGSEVSKKKQSEEKELSHKEQFYYNWTEVDSNVKLPFRHNDPIDKCDGELKFVIDICNDVAKDLSIECTKCNKIVGTLNDCVVVEDKKNKEVNESATNTRSKEATS